MNKKQQAIFDKMKESNYNVIKCADKEEANKVADIIGMPIIEADGLNLYVSSVEADSLKLDNDPHDRILCTGAEFLAMKDYDGEEYVEPNVEEIRFVTNLFENNFNEFKKQLEKPKVLEDAEQLVNQFDLIVNVLKEKAIGLNAGKLKKLIKDLDRMLHA